jgi:hypothetical protein
MRNTFVKHFVCSTIFVSMLRSQGIPEERKTLGKSKPKWRDSTKIDLKEMELEYELE